MRLFHTQVEVQGDILQVTEERILKHAKVIRLQVGDTISVQQQSDTSTTRRMIRITDLGKKCLEGEILTTDVLAHTSNAPGMLVGMPHTQEKLHLIVQKLTEIGIQDIVFWKNDWSTGHDISDKKMSKLCKISLETVEQCNARKTPTIHQIQDIHQRVVGKELVLFDFDGESSDALQGIPKDRLYGVIGPEGHFSPRDYETIGFQVVKKIGLGSNILRTETAAIIGGWLIQNS